MTFLTQKLEEHKEKWSLEMGEELDELFPKGKNSKRGQALLFAGLAYCFSRDFLSASLNGLIEEIEGEVVKELELHTHDSVPNYTSEIKEGCRTCITNQVLLNIKSKLEKMKI